MRLVQVYKLGPACGSQAGNQSSFQLIKIESYKLSWFSALLVPTRREVSASLRLALCTYCKYIDLEEIGGSGKQKTSNRTNTMKTATSSLIFMILCFTSCSFQTKTESGNSINFDWIKKHFNARNYSNEKFEPPLIYKAEDFQIEISDNPIPFEISNIELKKMDDKFPISYSVIYQDKLISLFEPGSFICHNISTMNRDYEFEKKINTKRFQYHWLLDNKLVGLCKGKYYSLDSESNWINCSFPVPFTHQPKLFEDDSYISFCDTHGEWGGTVYFFDKVSKKIYFTEATCANSILKKDMKYYVLSHLGHMMGSSELKEIKNPDKLSIVDIKNINKTVDGRALGYTDKSHASKFVFSWSGIQIFSSFIYQNRTLYIVLCEDVTFLAEIENNIIRIVNPLFNTELYTHDPITNLYGNAILMNLDFYGLGGEREIACIIIKDNKFTKLEWK